MDYRGQARRIDAGGDRSLQMDISPVMLHSGLRVSTSPYVCFSPSVIPYSLSSPVPPRQSVHPHPQLEAQQHHLVQGSLLPEPPLLPAPEWGGRGKG